MAAACRAAIPDAAHEFAQLGEIHGSMLEIHRDGIRVGASHSHALRIGIDSRTKPRAGIVYRLVIFPQLDHFIEAARLVIIVNGGRLHTAEDRGKTAAPCRRWSAAPLGGLATSRSLLGVQ